MLARCLVPDLVRVEDGHDARPRGLVVPRVDLGEHLPSRDLLAALHVADDADGVVDHVVLRAPAAADLERGVPDGPRTQAGHDAVTGRADLLHDLRHRKPGEVGIASCARIQRS